MPTNPITDTPYTSLLLELGYSPDPSDPSVYGKTVEAEISYSSESGTLLATNRMGMALFVAVTESGFPRGAWCEPMENTMFRTESDFGAFRELWEAYKGDMDRLTALIRENGTGTEFAVA